MMRVIYRVHFVSPNRYRVRGVNPYSYRDFATLDEAQVVAQVRRNVTPHLRHHVQIEHLEAKPDAPVPEPAGYVASWAARLTRAILWFEFSFHIPKCQTTVILRASEDRSEATMGQIGVWI
jgi:hypothetical protein